MFNSFFSIKSLDLPYPAGSGSAALGEFFGIHEGNDPTKRLMVVVTTTWTSRLHGTLGPRVVRVDPTNEASSSA